MVAVYLGPALGCALLAWQGWQAERQQPAAAPFAMLGVLFALCFASYAAYLLGVESLRFAYAFSAAFVPSTLMWLLDRQYRASPDEPVPSTATRLLRDVTAVAGVLFLVYELLDTAVRPLASAGEVVFGIVVQLAFLVPLRRLWTLERRSVTQVQKARIRVLLVLLGGAVAFSALELWSRALTPVTPADRAAIGALEYAWALQGRVPPLGAWFYTVFLYFLHRVISQQMDLRELVARAFTLSVSAAALVLVQELVAATFGDPRATMWAHRSFLLFVVGWGFLAVLPRLRRAVEVRAGEWFNQPAWALEQTLHEIDQAMAKALTLDGLDQTLLDPLQNSGRAPLVTLYLWSQDQNLFRLTRQRGVAGRPLMQTIGPRPFTDGFQRGLRAYVRDDLARQIVRRAPGHEEAADRLRTMEAMDADLTLPIRSGGEVIGWLNLRAAERAEGFAPDEVRRLAATVERAAIILENIASIEQNEEQRRLAALGTMAAGLAHEIRNPLAGIKGAAQYLQGQTDPDEIWDFLSVIVGEVDRLNNVVSQFLDYARPFRVETAPTDVGALIRASVELVRAEGLPAEVALEVSVDTGLPMVPLDRDKLRQVLLNLVQNAVQAVGTQGAVSVRASLGRMLGPSGTSSPCLVVAIHDTGPGVPPEDRARLFVPFHTTKPGGTGLGLAISRRLVVAHGGDITVRSQPGDTVFSVRLPIPETGLVLQAPEA